MMRRIGGGGAAALVLLLGGCLVPKVDYDAEVARNRALVVERVEREKQMAALERRIRDLEKTGENLELERSILDDERIKLIDDLESLRVGNEALQLDLEVERARREATEAEARELNTTYAGLIEELEQEVTSGKLEIHRLEGRLQVRALDQILFSTGSTVIRAEGREVLAHVAEQIRVLGGHRVSVEGHTDTVPISSERFPSNWELSAARAAGVARFLVENGLDPAKVTAAGRGEFHPIAPNDSREDRARNRRIEIVLVPEEDEG
jgi:chemotaxis protein MotB